MTTPHKSSLSLIAYFYKAYPGRTTAVFVLLLLSGLAETLGIGALLPLITMVVGGVEQAADNELSQATAALFAHFGFEPSLESLLLFVIGAITLKALIVFMAMRHVTYVAADISRQFRLRLMNALMRAKWSYFTGLPIGKISNYIATEAQRAGSCYILAGKATAALVASLVYIFAAFLVAWKISLLAVVLGGALVFFLKGLIRMARTAGQDMTVSLSDLLLRLNEALSGIKPLKAMAQEERFKAHLESDATDVLNAQKKQYLSSLLLQVIYEPVIVILLAAGLYFVLKFTATPVPAVLLLALLFNRLMTQVNLLQNHYQNMVQNESAVWALVKQSKEAETAVEGYSAGVAPYLENEIEFIDVSISHDGETQVFKDFSERVPANKVTVLFGPSGIGKTTLIDAVLGMVAVGKGEIRIDGTALSTIDIREWREMVGYVPQETFLFHDTIRKNVTLGDVRYSDQDIENALKGAAAWDFVQEQQQGLDTIVGERGGRLSGGQRQRIALARSLIRKPSLLIMDEATTGLDAESEKLVLESVENLKGKTTVIMISHNPEIKKLADKVIELKA